MYEIQTPLNRVEEAEHQLNARFADRFADRFAIAPAGHKQQRQSIDRIFTRHARGRPYTVEHKTDWPAGTPLCIHAKGRAFQLDF